MIAIHALFVVILLVPASVAWQTPSTQELADSSVARQDETFVVSNGAEPIEVVVSTDPEKIAQQTQRWEQVRDSIESSVRLAVDGDPSEIRSFTHSFVRRFQPTALKQHLQAILKADNADQQRQLKAAEWLLQFNDPLAVTWIIEQIINETALEPRVALISMLAKYSVEAHHSKAVTETGLTIPRSEKLFPAVLQTVREVNLVPYQDKSQEQQIMIGAINHPIALDAMVTDSDVPAMLDYLRQQTSAGYQDVAMLLWLAQRHPSKEALAIARQFAQKFSADSDFTLIQDTILALIRSRDQTLAQQAMDLYGELGDFQVTIKKGRIDSRGREPNEFEKRSDPISLDVWFHRARLIVYAMKQGVELPSAAVDPVREEFLRRIQMLLADVTENPNKENRLYSDRSPGVPMRLDGPTEPELQPIDTNLVGWLFQKSDNATVIDFLSQSDRTPNLAALQRVMKRPLELSEDQRKRRHESLKKMTEHQPNMPVWRWISTDEPLSNVLHLFQENGVASELSKERLLQTLKSHQANHPYHDANRVDWCPLSSLEHEVNSYDAIITLLESEHRIKLAYDGRMFGKFDDHFWLLVDISGGEFNPHAFTVKGRGTPEEYSRLSFIYRDKLYSMPYSIHADPGARYLLPIFNAILEREGVASRFHMTTGYFSLRNMFTSGVFVYYTPPQLVTQLEDRFAEAKE